MAATEIDVPVVAIGGITPERAREVAATRAAAGIAVAGGVMAAADPAEAVRRLMAPFQSRSGSALGRGRRRDLDPGAHHPVSTSMMASTTSSPSTTRPEGGVAAV